MVLRIAFIWGQNKRTTTEFWESKVDSMQHAIAELSKEHSVRIFIITKAVRPRQIINEQDITFCDTQKNTIINCLKQFNPNMIFLNSLEYGKWPDIIRSFPKTWKGIVDHGYIPLAAPLPDRLNAIIVQREYQREIASKVNKVPIEKVLYNPFCVKDTFRPLSTEKTHTGIMVADFRVNIKRQHLLIEAWKQISGRLILIGRFNRSRPSNYHLGCMRLAKEQGVSNRIDFMDGVPNNELPFIINKAKIAYLVSSREAGSRALPEMMACGLPAIVTMDCQGTSSLIKHGVDGWVTPPTPAGISTATSEVLKNWNIMGRRASHRIRRDYPYDRMLNFYRELIGSI